MRIVPDRVWRDRSPAERIITVAHPEFSVSTILASAFPGSASSQWFSANDPAAFPFALSEGVIVEQIGWLNGAAAGNNFDLGIYDTSFNRIVSTGSTGGTGNSVWQWANITDTALAPGRYYLAMAIDGVTANRINNYVAITGGALQFAGVLDSATDAFPLPNPLTNMAEAATITRIPVIAMATRTPFI